MKRSLCLLLTVLMLSALLTGCGTSAAPEPEDGARVADMSKGQRKAYAEQCRQTALESPLPAGDDVLVRGYAPIASEDFNICITVEAYVEAGEFSDYLVSRYRYKEVNEPPCSALLISCQVYDYNGQALPYMNDMVGISGVTASGYESPDILDDRYQYDGLEEPGFGTEPSQAGWVLAPFGADEPITALKFTTLDSSNTEHVVYAALPASSAAALPQGDAPKELAFLEETESGVTLLKASTGRAFYSSVRGNQFMYSLDDSDIIDAVVSYKGEAADLADMGCYAVINGATHWDCSVYLESGGGTQLLSSGSTAAGEDSILHFAVNSVPAGTVGNADIYFMINGAEYCFNYTLGEYAGSFQRLAKGESGEAQGLAKLELKEVKFQKSVKPARTGGTYTFFKAANESKNTLIAAKFSLTNFSGKELSIGSIAGATLTAADKTEYQGFVAAESENQRDLTTERTLKADATAACYAIVEVPKELEADGGTLLLSIGSFDFIIDVPAKAE